MQSFSPICASAVRIKSRRTIGPLFRFLLVPYICLSGCSWLSTPKATTVPLEITPEGETSSDITLKPLSDSEPLVYQVTSLSGTLPEKLFAARLQYCSSTKLGTNKLGFARQLFSGMPELRITESRIAPIFETNAVFITAETKLDERPVTIMSFTVPKDDNCLVDTVLWTLPPSSSKRDSPKSILSAEEIEKIASLLFQENA